MKRIIMSLALTVASATLALADSYNYLTVSAGSIEKSFALRQLKRITFVGDDMVVTKTDGSITETILNIEEPLKAGDLRIIKGELDAEGAVRPYNSTVGVSVTLDWNSGGEYVTPL